MNRRGVSFRRIMCRVVVGTGGGLILEVLSREIIKDQGSPFISPPNIYMHRKCEVPGSKCRFTSRN